MLYHLCHSWLSHRDVIQCIWQFHSLLNKFASAYCESIGHYNEIIVTLNEITLHHMRFVTDEIVFISYEIIVTHNLIVSHMRSLLHQKRSLLHMWDHCYTIWYHLLWAIIADHSLYFSLKHIIDIVFPCCAYLYRPIYLWQKIIWMIIDCQKMIIMFIQYIHKILLTQLIEFKLHVSQ